MNHEEAKQLVYEQLHDMVVQLNTEFPRRFHVFFDYREAADLAFLAVVPEKFDHNSGWCPVYEDAIPFNDRAKIDKALVFLGDLING